MPSTPPTSSPKCLPMWSWCRFRGRWVVDRLVDEFIFKFTHDIVMDWMLPGIPPTHKRVEVAFVVIVQFEGDKLAHEHIYWDQATVLAQLGLLQPGNLPIVGVAQAAKVVDPQLPSNELITGP